MYISKRSGMDHTVLHAIHHACLSFVCVHQMAPPLTVIINCVIARVIQYNWLLHKTNAIKIYWCHLGSVSYFDNQSLVSHPRFCLHHSRNVFPKSFVAQAFRVNMQFFGWLKINKLNVVAFSLSPHIDRCIFAPCTNILTYLLTYLQCIIHCHCELNLNGAVQE